jgi:hypothetical protein
VPAASAPDTAGTAPPAYVSIRQHTSGRMR